jgi:hypothetical protein
MYLKRKLKVDGSDLCAASDKVSFNLEKRMAKVWFKNKYDNV